MTIALVRRATQNNTFIFECRPFLIRPQILHFPLLGFLSHKWFMLKDLYMAGVFCVCIKHFWNKLVSLFTLTFPAPCSMAFNKSSNSSSSPAIFSGSAMIFNDNEICIYYIHKNSFIHEVINQNTIQIHVYVHVSSEEMFFGKNQISFHSHMLYTSKTPKRW